MCRSKSSFRSVRDCCKEGLKVITAFGWTGCTKPRKQVVTLQKGSRWPMGVKGDPWVIKGRHPFGDGSIRANNCWQAHPGPTRRRHRMQLCRKLHCVSL